MNESKTKKNILFLIGSLTSGGAERVISNLCNTLKNEYNITLVVRSNEAPDYQVDVPIITIPELKYDSRFPLGLLKLRRLKKKLKIDTTISFLTSNNIFNILTKKKDKTIVSIRNYLSLSEDINTNPIHKKHRKLLEKADCIVCVSESVKKDQQLNYKINNKNMIVIPNFNNDTLIKKQKTEDLPKEHKKIFNNKVIICPSRLTHQKGQWHLIRAFKKVVEYDKEARLVLMGRGILKNYYQDLIKELKLEKNVFILEHSKNVYKYIANSKIVILNSLYEGMPNILIEALSCNIPIISTDAPGGSREIIAPEVKGEYVKEIYYAKYGILIPMCDGKKYSSSVKLTKEENDIAQSIIKMLSDKKMYNNYKKLSKERIKEYDKEKIINLWKNII